jgi:ABC-type dipeptide/oligopeptide/nickel transport system ATPase component
LIGESGSGKTMTGMAMLGLVPKGSRIGRRAVPLRRAGPAGSMASRLRGRRIG